MNTIHPAIQLLNTTALIIFWLVPISAWWMLKGLQDHQSRLWYSGAGCYALTATIYAFSGNQGLVAVFLILFFSICTVFLLTEALRLELDPDRPVLSPHRILLVIALPSALLTGASLINDDLARAAHLSYLSLLELWLVILVMRIKRIWNSRSLDIILLVFAIFIVVNLARVLQWGLTAQMPRLLGFTLLSDIAVIMNIVSVIFYCFGYWGFALEKSQRKVEDSAQALIAAKAREQDADYQSTIAREREALLSRLFKFSRLAQAGTLSASIAHEVNQPLTSLRLNLDLASAELTKQPSLPTVHSWLERAREEAIRASGIIERIRKLFQQESLQLQPCVVDDLIERLIHPVMDDKQCTNLIITRSLRAPAPIPIAAGEFEHAFTNLLDNAVKSVRASKRERKTIAISTHQDPGLTVIEITDNGIGVPAALRDQLFDPAISNKTDGMGMGLWLTRYIIERHAGSIAFCDLPSGGARFTIQLFMRPECQAS